MVDEFVRLKRELTDEAIAVMGNAKNVDINNPEAAMTGTMKEKGQRAQPLFHLDPSSNARGAGHTWLPTAR
jgi:hypothetical protein